MRPLFLGLVSAMAATAPARALEPIPDKLVVLTFDDSSRSHITVAAPLLKSHGFQSRSGFDGQIVFRAQQGVDDRAVRRTMTALFERTITLLRDLISSPT